MQQRKEESKRVKWKKARKEELKKVGRQNAHKHAAN